MYLFCAGFLLLSKVQTCPGVRYMSMLGRWMSLIEEVWNKRGSHEFLALLPHKMADVGLMLTTVNFQIVAVLDHSKPFQDANS